MAATANIHDAKTNLSKLIERALAGEEVIIARAGKPLVRLQPVEVAKPNGRRGILGSMRGKITFADDWDSPETNAEIERLLYEGDTEARGRLGIPDPDHDDQA
jgi:prevent-host-death family protein